MAKNGRIWSWKLAGASLFAMGGAISSSFECAIAQITPDGTLGAESSVVTPTNINGIPSEQIDGGATRGANLFHSFEQFSIPTGGEAYFNNALDIQNIISRVTGSSISNIDGLLRANGTANLFLLNPNGINFGSNARLSIGGSFVGSTASSLNFADGTQFSATAPTTTPLLTVSVPLGLQFGGTAGSIVNRSRVTNSSGERVGLQVSSGRTLGLVGGNVSLEGGGVQAPGGRVELGGVAGAGTVGLSVDSNNLLVSFPDGVGRADVYLTRSGSNTARVNVASSNGGSIAITARNIDISGASELSGGPARGLGFPGAQAGDIDLRATGTINVASGYITNNLGTGSVGQAGNINLTTGSLAVRNGELSANTFGQGNAGRVNINARDTVSFDGESAAFSQVGSQAVGNGGDINITTGSLSVTNGAQLSALTFGQGDAGSVTINARDTVSFDGVSSDGYFSAAGSLVGREAVGNGGDINITTGSLSVTNGAQMGALTFGQGDAGSVTINARNTVSFDGVGSTGFPSLVSSAVDLGAVGNGGNINITTGSLSVTDGARLSVRTFGRGDAGSVTINARDTVSLDGVGSNGDPSLASTAVESGAVGNGGSVNVTTGSLSVTNGAQLQAFTGGQGDAGSVTINARETVSFDGVGSNGFPSLAASGVEAGAVGNGGNINITTGSLALTNGAGVSASSEGSGVAGSIEVAADSIRLENLALLRADTTAGQGNINLRSGDLVLRGGSNITTNATGTAPGGNITIDTGVIAALENSDISANSTNSFGGRVRIDAQGIFGTQFRLSPTLESDITATGGRPGLSGTVEINNPDVDPSQGLVNLPAELVDASNQIAAGCPSGVFTGESKFIITGRGGLPPNPNEPLNGDNVLTDWATLDSDTESLSSATSSTNSTKQSAPTQIVEATGWMTNNKGEVILTATAPTATLDIPWLPDSGCNAPEPES